MRGLHPHALTNLAGGLFEGISQQLSANLSQRSVWTPTTAPVDTLVATAATTDIATPEANLGDSTQGHAGTPITPDPIRSVFLFTDGKPTAGIVEANRIIQIMENVLTWKREDITNNPDTGGGDNMDSTDVVAPENNEAEQPQARPEAPTVKIHTFGFGRDTDSHMLSTIAEKGCGTYYYINTPDDIPAAFADALGGLLSVAAQNVVLRISPDNGARITAVRCGFDTVADGADWVVRLPDLYAEEVKDIVVTFELPSLHGEDVPEDVEFVAARVRIEFIDTVRATPALLTGDIRISRSAEAEAQPTPAGANARVRAQVMRLDAMDSMLRV